MAFFEIIFMTYSYVHTKINEEAFPEAINLYDKEIMTGRGNGKYGYKEKNRIEAEKFLREQITMTDFLVPKRLCTNWQKKVVSRLLQHMTLNCVKCRKRK